MNPHYDESQDSSKMSDAEYLDWLEKWLDKADEQARVQKIYPVFAGRGAIRRLLEIARNR